ncbi:unnamed protein product [Trichobilharzia regenti]|nr:unnamed protein product [Trichobilharzia regenti]
MCFILCPDWYEVDWFWTKVECSQGIPGCPPIDFYHATAVSLPYREVNKPYVSTENRDFIQTNSCYSDNRMENVFTVAIISQPTAALLDEAAKQRKYWQRIKMSSELTSTSYRKNATDQISGMPADDGNEKEDLLQKPCHLADINRKCLFLPFNSNVCKKCHCICYIHIQQVHVK